MKALTNIFVSLIFIVVLMEGIIEQIFLYPKNSTIPKFRKKLRKLGYRLLIDIEPESFCYDNPDKSKDLVLKFYNKLDDGVVRDLVDKSFYIECLWFVKDFEVFDFMLEELEKYYQLKIEEEYTISLLSELSYITKDLSRQQEYINMFKKHDYYVVSKELIKICSNFPSEELNELLAEEIKYYSNRGLDEAKKVYIKTNKNGKKLIEKYSKDKYITENPLNVKSLIEKDKKMMMGEYPNDSTIYDFIKDLEVLSNKKISNLKFIEFCQNNPVKTKDLILNYYNKAILPFDQRVYLRCLMNEMNKDLFEFIYSEIDRHISIKIGYGYICNSIDNYFIKSRDTKFKDRYLKYLKEAKYSETHFGIYEAMNYLRLIEGEGYTMNLIKNDIYLGNFTALKYLSRMRDTQKYQEIFERYLKSDDPEIRALCRKNLEKIKKNKK